jgi:predicted ATPase
MIYLDTLQIAPPPRARADGFPFNVPLFRNGLTLKFDRAVTVFAGENGSGKSTLLESLAVACEFPRLGGTVSNAIRKTYGADRATGDEIVINADNLELATIMKLSWRLKTRKGYFLRAEYMTDTLAQHFHSARYLSVSHGEGIIEMVKDFFKDGLFILDEPETALSPTSQLALLALIRENTQKYGAQYIIVTHSPILMGIPESDFRWIDGGTISKMPYTDCPHFQITKAFLNDPQRLIREL